MPDWAMEGGWVVVRYECLDLGSDMPGAVLGRATR